MEEIEVKFLNIDPDAIQRKLLDIGARKEGEYFYRRRVFDYPDWRLDKNNSWLRLRDEDGRTTLSFKRRLGVSKHDGSTQDSGMEEIEIEVSDFDKMAMLLLTLGFVEKHYAENRRVRWVKDDIEFDIDIWPKLEPYLEIEAPSWEKIDAAIHLLGFKHEDKKIFSTNQIYKLKDINVAELQRITFDEGLVKREEV